MSGVTIDLTSPMKEDSGNQQSYSSSASGTLSNPGNGGADGDVVAVAGQRGKSKVPLNEGRSTSKHFIGQTRKSGNGTKAPKTSAFGGSVSGVLGKRMVAGASDQHDDDFMSPEKEEAANGSKRKKKTAAASSSSSSSASSSSSSSSKNLSKRGGAEKQHDAVASLSSDPYKVLNNQTEIIKKTIGNKNISNIPDPRARLEFLMDSLSKISESQAMLSVVEQRIRTEMKKASKLQLAQSAKGPINMVTEKEVIDEEIVASLFPKLSESELASTKDWWNKTNLQGSIEHSNNSVVLSVQRGYNQDGTALTASPVITAEAEGEKETAPAVDTPPAFIPVVEMVDKATNTSSREVTSLLDSSQSQSQSQSQQSQPLAETETESESSHVALQGKVPAESVTVDLLGSSEELDAPHIPDGLDDVANNDAVDLEAEEPPLAVMKQSAKGSHEGEEEEIDDDIGLTQAESQMEAIVDLLARDHPVIYQKILLFHPVPLEDLHACLKGNVRIGKEALKKLMAQHHVFITQNKATSSATKSHATLNGAKYRQWSK